MEYTDIKHINNNAKTCDGDKCSVSIMHEKDGSYTVAIDEMDIAENADTEERALIKLAASILDYAMEYYDNYHLYNGSSNRSGHLPYVTKAFLLGNAERIRDEMMEHKQHLKI